MAQGVKFTGFGVGPVKVLTSFSACTHSTPGPAPSARIVAGDNRPRPSASGMMAGSVLPGE